LSGWFNGDFNYDGVINIDDYGIIDVNIGIQGPPLTSAASAAAPSDITAAVFATGGEARTNLTWDSFARPDEMWMDELLSPSAVAV
jgi:hypothetical protein